MNSVTRASTPIDLDAAMGAPDENTPSGDTTVRVDGQRGGDLEVGSRSSRPDVRVVAVRAAVVGALSTIAASLALEWGLGVSADARGDALAWVRFAVVIAAGAIVSVVDLRERRIPNLVTYPVAAAILASASTETVWRLLESPLSPIPGAWSPFVLATLGALAAGATFFALAWFGTLGFGDVKLALVLGAGLLPVADWGGLALAGVAAYVLALPHALVALIRRRAYRTADRDPTAVGELPFGPYLLAGTLVAAGATLVA